MTIIKANKININYEIEGKGTAIVFIHGLSDNLNYWNKLSDVFKDKYKTIKYDLRGHGKSDKGDEIASIELYQEDLYCLLEELKIKKAIFIGLSLGGNIALKFATTHPEMVKGLVIMSSYSEFNHKLNHIFSEFEKAIEINFEEFYDTILPYVLPEELIEANKEKLEEIKEKSAETSNCQGILNGLHAGHKFFITNDLKKIKAPTLIIAGEEDELTDLSLQRKIYRNIENSEFITLPDTKHNILINRNFNKVKKLIEDFFKENKL